MEQPTEKQVKKFWEHFGFKYRSAGDNFISWWVVDYPDGSQGNCLKSLIIPCIHVNSLFKYAIPKLQNEGYQIDIVCHEHKGFNVCVWDVKHDNGKSGGCSDDDLGLALFGVIWEVIK